MAAGDLAGAETALQGLDKFNGFEPLKVFQLGLLYDFAGKPDKARQFYDKAIGASEQLNWRLTEVVANFDERHGRGEQAQALYDRFIQREQQQRSGDRGRRDPRRRSAEAADRLRRPTGSPRRCSISPAC